MKRNYLKPLLLVGCLVVFTCTAIGYANRLQSGPVPPPVVKAKQNVLTLSGRLVQDKILVGDSSPVALALTITADDVVDLDKGEVEHVDMVIVLDRSGSMRGEKLENARRAVLDLISNLTSKDRLALVTYSDEVQRCSNLLRVTDANRERLESMVKELSAGGATNLGGGLNEGIKVLLAGRSNGNLGKVILISDGLANRGIVSPASLGRIASIAVEKEFAVSTVGVGDDFNEQLMTAIADGGTGNYYYLENPDSFAEVFQNEFHKTRTAAATSVEVRVPLKDGVSLASAGGYPVKVENGVAIFHPGDILSGQSKKLFLSLQVVADKARTFEINGINIHYKHKGDPYTITLAEPFQIACVRDQSEVFTSIDKDEWEEKVLKDDYNKLREEVSVDIKEGRANEALGRIKRYYQAQQAVNSAVGSAKVASNLDREVCELEELVNHTFQGKPQEVELKQKRNAKALQFDAYKGRRASEPVGRKQ